MTQTTIVQILSFDFVPFINFVGIWFLSINVHQSALQRKKNFQKFMSRKIFRWRRRRRREAKGLKSPRSKTFFRRFYFHFNEILLLSMYEKWKHNRKLTNMPELVVCIRHKKFLIPFLWSDYFILIAFYILFLLLQMYIYFMKRLSKPARVRRKGKMKRAVWSAVVVIITRYSGE